MEEELPEDLREVFLGYKPSFNPDAKPQKYCEDRLTTAKLFTSAPTALHMANEKIKSAKQIGETMFVVKVTEGADLSDLDKLESETIASDISSIKAWVQAHPPARKWKASIDKANFFIALHDTADPEGTNRYVFVCDNLTVGLKRIKKAL